MRPRCSSKIDVVWFALALCLACGDGASTRSEAGQGGGDAEQSAPDPAFVDDAREGDDGSAAEDADAAEALPAEAGAPSLAAGDAALDAVTYHPLEAGREAGADAGLDASDGPLDASIAHDAARGGDADAEVDAGLPPPFTQCHALDPLGDLVRPQRVSAPWDAPAGGSISSGRYNLVAEEYFVPATASAEEAEECGQYWGDYRELLVVDADELQRVARFEGISIKRETFSYQIVDRLIQRTVVCASDQNSFLYPPKPAPFSAWPDQLWLFDGYHRGDDPSTPRICELIYKYVRMP